MPLLCWRENFLHFKSQEEVVQLKSPKTELSGHCADSTLSKARCTGTPAREAHALRISETNSRRRKNQQHLTKARRCPAMDQGTTRPLTFCGVPTRGLKFWGGLRPPKIAQVQFRWDAHLTFSLNKGWQNVKSWPKCEVCIANSSRRRHTTRLPTLKPSVPSIVSFSSTNTICCVLANHHLTLHLNPHHPY